MKIREQWLVEGVSIRDGGLLVEFDSRQNLDQAVAPARAPSKITKVEDGDDQIQMSTGDGRAFAGRIGERVWVTLEIDDGAPREYPKARRLEDAKDEIVRQARLALPHLSGRWQSLDDAIAYLDALEGK